MQVFMVDLDPRRAAACLDDGRLGKMILESAQILKPGGYVRHPCVAWGRRSLWVAEYHAACSAEWIDRFRKRHGGSMDRSSEGLDSLDSLASTGYWDGSGVCFDPLEAVLSMRWLLAGKWHSEHVVRYRGVTRAALLHTMEVFGRDYVKLV